MKIIGINGSPFVKSRTSDLLNQVLKTAENLGAETEVINLAENKMNLPSGKLGLHYKDEKSNDDMPEIYEKLINADALIFATPTHWFNVSSLIKIFIDRLTVLEESGFLLEGKVVGFIAWGPEGGATNALENLALIFNHAGCVIPPYALMYITNDKYEWMEKDLALMAQNIIKQVKAQKLTNISWGY